jgi:hypothetical protein
VAADRRGRGGSVTGLRRTARLSRRADQSIFRWTFLARAPGETTLELRSFYPHCPKDQPCPMMPEFSMSFTLVIEGEPIAAEPVVIEDDIIAIGEDDFEQTIDVQPGQIVKLDLDDMESPYHVIYQPAALEYLPGGQPLFRVLPYGMLTRLGWQSADGTLFAVNLAIEPLCDSCGVRRGY